MDKMKKTVLSETEVEETKPKDKEEKKEETKESPLIGGNGLLELIHDAIEQITDIISKLDTGKEDKVEFEEDASPMDDFASGKPGFIPPVESTQEFSSKGAPDFGGKGYGFEILSDNDFDGSDPVVKNFQNDMGGCGGMVKVLSISGPETVEKLSVAYDKLNKIRVAQRAKELDEVFQHVNAAASGKGAKHQLIAVQKLDKLANDSSREERFALLRAKEAVLAGTIQHFDAAGYRVRAVYSKYAPEQMVRTAYTNLETQSGDLIMMPQGRHQIGHPTTLELSKFRDQSVDAKIDVDTGDVKNGYVDFEKRRDSMEAARNRFEIHRNPVNDESLLTLAKGERSKPLTKNDRTYEQRLDEDTKNRYNEKNWNKSREEALDDTPEASLGHHGDPKEDESIAHTLCKTASVGVDRIDPDSSDTFGEQLSKGHAKAPNDDTLEQMLADEHVGLTDDELNMLLEEWLERSREDNTFVKNVKNK